MNNPNLLVFSGTVWSDVVAAVEKLANLAATRHIPFSILPKFTTRRPHEDHGDELIVVQSFPGTANFLYMSYGSFYALDIAMARQVSAGGGLGCLTIRASHNDIARLRQHLKGEARFIWVDREVHNDTFSQFLERELEPPRDLASRLQTAAARRPLPDSRKWALFDVLVLNDGRSEFLESQLGALLVDPSLPTETLWEESRLDRDSQELLRVELIVISEDAHRYFAKYPEKLHTLEPREFEEFIAGLYERHRWQVELTPATRDRGVDLRIARHEVFGRMLWLVECKRYSPDRAVGISVVQRLHGVRDIEHGNGSIIVTTSRFSRDATREAQRLGCQMALVDYDALRASLQCSGAPK